MKDEILFYIKNGFQRKKKNSTNNILNLLIKKQKSIY